MKLDFMEANNRKGMPKRRWIVAKPAEEQVVEKLQAATGQSRVLCSLMARRGITTLEEARAFIRPRIEDLHDPFLMLGMEEAVGRLLQAREDEEIIGVHGDYDADGLTSTAFLVRFLSEQGWKVRHFIPHRMQDGYGIAKRAVDYFLEEDASILLTCDAGISANEEIAYAREEGLYTIVTDHHTPPEELPNAHVIINPHQENCSYPFKPLSGAGVAFKLGQALVQKLDLDEKEHLFKYLDLVGLGTVCDQVELTGENRIIAFYGIRVISHTENPGLKELMKVADVKPDSITARTFDWVLGPRLNATGRIDAAEKGLELLLEEDEKRAEELALELDAINNRRKQMGKVIEEQAFLDMESKDVENLHGLVLFGEDEEVWHHGILGIVASRVVETYSRPAFLFAKDPGTNLWKGSGRSLELSDVNLYKVLKGLKKYIKNFGGHKGAAGATLRDLTKEELQEFAEGFNEGVKEYLTEEDLIPAMTAEMEAEFSELTGELYDLLLRFSPFGQGNPEINFITKRAKILSAKGVGGDQSHLKFTAEKDGTYFSGIGFGLARDVPETVTQATPYEVDLLYKLDMNEYRGRTELQLKLKDLRIIK